ncbi:SKP1/BTB/POZ domain, NPH3 domain protein [Babesia caballi]|uniref:SKP1/BTB/POZ domain, NPH3 domain protein n=1 Tax=Babesia caballi TaxID=5871 RepID=A0AAV4LYZ1_BABCB|nr:SKP1/BTB/POZ domain, NPH3 domain protein [Babesia caballi]
MAYLAGLPVDLGALHHVLLVVSEDDVLAEHERLHELASGLVEDQGDFVGAVVVEVVVELDAVELLEDGQVSSGEVAEARVVSDRLCPKARNPTYYLLKGVKEVGR